MKSFKDYGNYFLDEMLALKIPPLEVALMAALALMCLSTVIEYNLGGDDIGGQQQLRLARQQAQEELMALRSSVQPN